MLVLLLSALAFLGLMTGSFLITYYVFGILNQGASDSEPSINDTITSQMTQLVQMTITAAGDMLTTISSKFFGLVSNIQTNLKTYLNIGILTLVILSYTMEKEAFLSNIDKLWRCGLHPFFTNILFSILQALRLLFGGLVPIYNFNTFVGKQLAVGSRLTVFTCSFNSLFESLVILLNLAISVFQSITLWTGFGGELSMDNNLLFNELSVTKVIIYAQKLVLKQSEVAGCACGGLTDVFEFIWIACRQDEIAFAINHLVNVPVSLIQALFQAMPPWSKMPLGEKMVHHLNGFIYYVSKYADQVMIKWIVHAISLFDDNFKLEGVPDEFAFVILGRLAMGGVHIGWMAARTLISVAMPFTQVANPTVPLGDAIQSAVNQVTKGDYMVQVASMDLAMEQLSLSNIGLSNLLGWGMQIGYEASRAIAKAAISGEPLSLILPAHKHIVCNRDISNYFDNIACGIRVLLNVPLDTTYLVYSLFVELLFKSFLNEEQNAIITIQRYDGISFPRNVELTCEYRASINYDLTAKECRCDPGMGMYRGLVPEPGYPFGRPYYDRFCGQPNLQVNYFGNAERAVNHLTSGWAALIGEMGGVLVTTAFELMKTGFKGLFNLGNIISGDYYSYKTNCGYGVTDARIRTWFNETDNTTTFQEKIEKQFEDMRKYGQNYPIPGDCNEDDQIPFYDIEEKRYRCELIDKGLRDMMCLSTSNPNGKEVRLWDGSREKVVVSMCDKINTAGCECNFLLPLEADTPCQCIRNFPDTLMEYSSRGFRNPVMQAMYSTNVSLHWCNTFWLEWLLKSVQSYADVIENVAGVFHPSYKSDANGANEFCARTTFPVAAVKVLRFPRYKFERDPLQYNQLSLSYTENSCSLWGSANFICSIGLTLDNAVAVVLNEVRMVVMTLNKFLDADFSGVKISLGERICDVAKILSALASVLPSVLPDGLVGVSVQQGLTKVLYSAFHGLTSALDIINVVLTFLDDMIKGELEWTNGDSFPIFNLIFTIVNIVIDWFRLILTSFGFMLNALERGAGNALYTIDRVVGVVQDHLLNEAAFEIIGLSAKIVLQIIEFMTSGAISGGFFNFFKELFNLVIKIVKLVLKAAGKVLSIILDLMGPAGKFIRNFANSICPAIENVLVVLSGKPQNVGCTPLRHRRHLFSSGEDDAKYQDIVHHFANDIPWNGTSNCDMFVHSYKHYKWDDLRPAEHIQMLDCIQNRYIMFEFNKEFGTNIPEDLLYNWERKWIMMRQFVHTGVVYLEHKLGVITAKQMIQKLRYQQVDFNDWLPLITKINNNIGHFFTLSTLHQGIEFAFREHDPHIEKGTTALSSMYRLYSIGVKATTKIRNHTRNSNFRRDVYKMSATIQTHMKKFKVPSLELPAHVYHGWDTYMQVRQPPRSKSKLYAGHLLLKASGLQTDISPCSERKDSFVCLNCAILDNLLSVIIREGNQVSQYYNKVYAKKTVPSFVRFWTNSSASAWREDAGAALKDGFDSMFPDEEKAQEAVYNDVETYGFSFGIDSEGGPEVDSGYDPNKDPVIKLERPKLRYFISDADVAAAEANKTIPYNLRVQKDWEWFFFEQGWNPFKEHPKDQQRKSFPRVVIDFVISDYDEYVPFFERSLRYYMWQPISECPNEKLYCTWNTFEERQTLITNSFGIMLWTTLAIFGVQFLTGIPTFSLLTPYLIFIYGFIYMFSVYGYTYKCLPTVPNCLLEDLYAFIHDKLYPTCFCYYLPGIAKSCNPDTCFLCTRTTEFSECRRLIPEVDDLGLAWAPIFWLRVYLPDVLVFMYQTVPFSWILRPFDSIKAITKGAIETIAVTQIEMDCLNISYIDIGLSFVFIWLATQVLSIGAPLIVRAFQHVINLSIIFVSMIYSMAVSLEIQTVTVKEA